MKIIGPQRTIATFDLRALVVAALADDPGRDMKKALRYFLTRLGPGPCYLVRTDKMPDIVRTVTVTNVPEGVKP
jgi:hypothetical protein